jgi:glutamate-1-semialdehyde aminotransferase
MIRQYNPIRKGIGIIRRNKSSFTAAVFDRSEQLPVHIPPMKRAKGPYLYDYDENRYVDFELSRGSLLLGHAPAVLCSTLPERYRKQWGTVRAMEGGFSTTLPLRPGLRHCIF